MIFDAWAKVPGFPDYAASAGGLVMRVTDGRSTWAGRVLGPTPDRDGYMLVSLRADGRRRMAKVHQLVLEAFVGPRPPRMETLHLNARRDDNRLSNLRWGTRAENTAAQRRAGGSLPGAANPSAKLTDEQVLDIYQSKETYAVLLERYGVSSATIWRIRQGHAWTHVTQG